MDEQTKKDFTEILEKTLDKKFEEKFIPLFNQGFEEIVLPNIERLDQGQEDIKSRLDRMESRLDTLERRSDRILDRSNRVEGGLKDLSGQLRRLRKSVDELKLLQGDDNGRLSEFDKRIQKIEHIVGSANP